MYQQRLTEAIDTETARLKDEYEHQLESQLLAIRDQSNKMIELRTSEIRLEFELKNQDARNEIFEEMREKRDAQLQDRLRK